MKLLVVMCWVPVRGGLLNRINTSGKHHKREYMHHTTKRTDQWREPAIGTNRPQHSKYVELFPVQDADALVTRLGT